MSSIRRLHQLEGGPFDRWSDEELSVARKYASEIIVRYAELHYDASHLPVTHYRKQRRVSARLDELLSPILKETVRRTGSTEEPVKKEARSRAYPKDKHGRIPLDFMHERFRLILMHRTAA